VDTLSSAANGGEGRGEEALFTSQFEQMRRKKEAASSRSPGVVGVELNVAKLELL
jgi:hypothetical protein